MNEGMVRARVLAPVGASMSSMASDAETKPA
jgi:hypothetical protein